MDSTIAPSFETAVSPGVTPAARSGFAMRVDPLTIGLSMVNWLFLMLLMSGLMLAATMSHRSEPAGSSGDISTSTTR